MELVRLIRCSIQLKIGNNACFGNPLIAPKPYLSRDSLEVHGFALPICRDIIAPSLILSADVNNEVGTEWRGMMRVLLPKFMTVILGSDHISNPGMGVLASTMSQ
jgi:hypothetical protein